MQHWLHRGLFWACDESVWIQAFTQADTKAWIDFNHFFLQEGSNISEESAGNISVEMTTSKKRLAAVTKVAKIKKSICSIVHVQIFHIIPESSDLIFVNLIYWTELQFC